MKIPEPRKLPSGNWFIQLRLGGKSTPITAPTAKECTRLAMLAKADYSDEKKKAASPSPVTLEKALRHYIDRYESVLSPSTIMGYETILRTRFLAFQKQTLSEIDWQQMINDETKAVSAKTVRNAWGLVKSAIKLETGSVPGNIRLPQVPVREIPFLQPDEIKPFCAAIRGNIAEIPALLELHGLRRSEMLALDWKDIDLKRGLIHIRGAVVPDKSFTLTKKETNKSKSSTRTIPIMIPQLKDALTAAQSKSGRVVTIAGDTAMKNIKRCCEDARITVVGNHGLRHSFASLAYHLGISERQLMELGGWSDFQTMHKIYIRVAASSENAAQNAISAFFEDKPESKTETKSEPEDKSEAKSEGNSGN